jgi:hypothetical protein
MPELPAWLHANRWRLRFDVNLDRQGAVRSDPMHLVARLHAVTAWTDLADMIPRVHLGHSSCTVAYARCLETHWRKVVTYIGGVDVRVLGVVLVCSGSAVEAAILVLVYHDETGRIILVESTPSSPPSMFGGAVVEKWR